MTRMEKYWVYHSREILRWENFLVTRVVVKYWGDQDVEQLGFTTVGKYFGDQEREIWGNLGGEINGLTWLGKYWGDIGRKILTKDICCGGDTNAEILG